MAVDRARSSRPLSDPKLTEQRAWKPELPMRVPNASAIQRNHARVALFAFVVVVTFLRITGAFADGDLPTYYQTTGMSPDRITLNQSLDEHIDPFTGKLQLHHVDLAWPGNGGFDLNIQRAFNSPAPTFGSASDTASFNLTPNIGVGWRMFIG